MLQSATSKACCLLTGLVMAVSAPALGKTDKDEKPPYKPARFVEKVLFSYMTYNAKNDTYRRQAQWRLQNVANWQKFAQTLQKLPRIDNPPDRPKWTRPAAPDTDHIRIRILTTNDFTTRIIDIYENIIRIISRSPKTIFYKPEINYLQHLREKQQSYKAFPEKLIHTDIAQKDNGIFVRYKRYAHLPNPVWRVDSRESQNRLFDMLVSLTTMPRRNVTYARRDITQSKTANIIFKNVATPGNFSEIQLTGSFVRGEKIKRTVHYLKDNKNYFAFFKNRAARHMQ